MDPPSTPRTPQRTPRRSMPRSVVRQTPSSRMMASPGTRSPSRRLISSFNSLTLGVDTTSLVDNFIIIELAPKRIRAGFPYQPKPVCDMAVNDPSIGVDDTWDALWTDENDLDQISIHLEAIFRSIFDQLLINAKHQRCVILQPTFMPSPVKKAIADLLLVQLRVNSLNFLPSAVCATLASGGRNALVIDLVGWNQITITPVYDLREMVPQSRTTSIGLQKLFEDNDNDDDELPLDIVVAKISDAMDIDSRAGILNNIIVITDDVQLHQEICNQLGKSQTKCRFIETLGPWVGAGLYISSIGWYLVQEERARLPGEMSKERYQSGERWICD